MAVARELSKNETPRESILVCRESLQETAISALDCLEANEGDQANFNVTLYFGYCNCCLGTCTCLFVGLV